jgi:hypothetical protein
LIGSAAGEQDQIDEYLASVIPGARLHICPGEAHLLIWNHLPEVLLTAARRAPATGLYAQGLSALPPRVESPETRAMFKVEVS